MNTPSDDKRPRRSPCETGCELLKALRGRWMTRNQIANEMECATQALLPWLTVMQEHGLVLQREAPRQGWPDQTVTEYTLAPAWIGAGR